MGMLLHKINIELLTPVDLDWFVDVAATNMLKYEAKREDLVNREQLYNLSVYGMVNETAFVAKIGDRCLGGVGGILLPHVFNPSIKVFSEVFWYVLPEYRRTRAGALLLKTFMDTGERLADEMTLSLLGSSEIKQQTLEKKGFYLEEFVFRKRMG